MRVSTATSPGTTSRWQFEGTLVLVSHDRHLLRATTDQFLIVADGTLRPFDGDLEDYREWLFRTKLVTASAEAAERASVFCCAMSPKTCAAVPARLDDHH